MSKHAMPHILISHKPPKIKEWTGFLFSLKFRQLAWWQSAALSLSDVTSYLLLLLYFRFEVPSALCSFLVWKTFPLWCLNTWESILKRPKNVCRILQILFKKKEKGISLQSPVENLYICMYLVPHVFLNLNTSIQNSTGS